MKLCLENQYAKKVVANFPAVLDEIRDNIRKYEGMIEDMVSPNAKEKVLIAATKKYIATMKQALPLGEKAWITMKLYKTTITDNTAMLLMLEGFAYYAINRTRELERVRKQFANEKFYFTSSDKQVVISGLAFDGPSDEKAEDLTYIQTNLYANIKAFHADGTDAIKKSNDAKEWLGAVAKSPAFEKLPAETKEIVFDFVRTALYAGDSVKAINSIFGDVVRAYKKSNDEEFKISQCLLARYNQFLRKLFTDCWAFKVEHNL